MTRKNDKIKVQITKRDFEELSDCDDLVKELCELNGLEKVEITFNTTSLDAIRAALHPSQTGFGSDVKVIETKEQGAFAFEHNRGL